MTYKPREEQIKAVLVKAQNDARTLAIAYLLATRRANDAEKALKVSEAARNQMRRPRAEIDEAISSLFGLGKGRR